MKQATLAFAITVFVLRAACAAAETGMMPALPASTVPPTSGPPRPLPDSAAIPDAAKEPTAAPSRGTSREKDGEYRPPKITLGEQHEKISPEWHGAGMAEGAMIGVKASGRKLTAVLAASTYAHCYFGVHSSGQFMLQLVQEVEISAGSSGPLVDLVLSAKLDGYIRSEETGSACLHLADAAIHPVAGGPGLFLTFPPFSVAGGQVQRLEKSIESAPLTVPSGRYVIVANLALSAAVCGVFHGHAEAIFDSTPSVSWSPLLNPFRDVDRKDFGLNITLRASDPR